MPETNGQGGELSQAQDRDRRPATRHRRRAAAQLAQVWPGGHVHAFSAQAGKATSGSRRMSFLGTSDLTFHCSVDISSRSSDMTFS